MLEANVFITLLGFVLASNQVYGKGNPFQIYFVVWFLDFFVYYVTQTSWIPLSSTFLCLFFALHIIWFISFFIASPYIKTKETQFNTQLILDCPDKHILDILQLICVLALPLTYLKALELTGGMNIFTVFGFIKLRSVLLDGVTNYGWLSYVTPLSFVISSVSLFIFKYGKIPLFRLLLSIAVSVAYCYLSTGRTFFLLFFVLLFFPLFLTRKIKLTAIITSVIILIVAFILVATMTARGVATDASLKDNSASFIKNIRGYTVAPLVAFSTLVERQPDLALGKNTFRILFSVSSTLGLVDANSLSLVREFVSVPDDTNVYTVYDPYYSDFGGCFFIFVFLFIAIHVVLYRRAIMKGNIYIFWYSASAFPLIMQFFQDQYFSLFSIWVQIFFWYWIVINGIGLPLLREEQHIA